MGVTYNQTENKITVTGYSEVTPCNFTDIYNADKAGAMALHARTGITGIDGAAVAVDNAERPADYVVLGGASNDLYITIANWNGTTATIQITGTDRDDVAQTEDVVVTANGNYYTTKWFKTITHTQVTVFNATTFDYDLTQGQWGVVSKLGDKQIYISCHLTIGNGTTVTHLRSIDGESIHLGTYSYALKKELEIEANATLQFGLLDTNGYGYRGAHLYLTRNYYNSYNLGNGVFKFYDSKLSVRSSSDASPLTFSGVVEFIDSSYYANRSVYLVFWDDASILKRFFLNYGTPTITFNIRCVADVESITLGDYAGNIYGGVNSIISDIVFESRGYIHNRGYGQTSVLIDCIIPVEQFFFYLLSNEWGIIYKEFHFDLKVIDRNNNILDATVRVWDSQDLLVLDTTTGIDGKITQALFTVWEWEKGVGTSEKDIKTDYNPFTLQISKTGYPTYKTELNIDAKTELYISLDDYKIGSDSKCFMPVGAGIGVSK